VVEANCQIHSNTCLPHPKRNYPILLNILGLLIDLLDKKNALNIDNRRANLPQVESVKFSCYNIGPTLAADLSKDIMIQLFGDISLRRKFAATNAHNTKDYGFKNGAFLNASIFFVK